MTCARCLAPFATPADLGAHLMAHHAVNEGTARREARVDAGITFAPPAPSPPVLTREEPPMPTGVYERTSDPAKPCGYCHQQKDAHADTCRRNPALPRAAKRPGKAKTRPHALNGKAPVSGGHATNGADPIAAIRAALLQIEAELVSMRDLKAAMAKALGA